MLKRCFHGFPSASTCLHPLKSLTLYSTSVASSDAITGPPAVEFLVKAAGFSEDEAISIASKVSRRSKSFQNPQLVVDFLKINGFDDTQIRRMITLKPNVLHCNIDKTLEPKFRAFQGLGLSGSNLGLFISQCPHLLRGSLNSHILPLFELLKSIVGSDEQVVALLLKIKSQPWLISSALKNLPQNIALLRRYGVTTAKIKKLMLERPELFLLGTQWFEEKVKSVEEKLGIPRTSGMFVHGIFALCRKNEDKLDSCFQVFRSHGWSETEVFDLVRRFPNTINMAEKSVRAKLKYLMEDLGFGPDYLAAHPPLLSLSMEKRILPRVAVRQTLMDNGLLKVGKISVYTCVMMTESKFMAKFVLPYKQTLPELYDKYTLATSNSL